MEVPSRRIVGSDILWLWHDDMPAPVILRYLEGTFEWEGWALRLSVGSKLPQGWHWCSGRPGLGLPRDSECLIKLNNVSWEGYPSWFMEAYLSKTDS